METHSKNSQEIDTYILEEFKHASVYTLQMLQDRANVFTLYVAVFSVLATALGFFFKPGDQAIKYSAYSSLIPYTLVLLGMMHSFFFVRLGYIDKKYNYYVRRMNTIREFYVKRAKLHGNMYSDIKNVIPSIKMPHTWAVVYPLFPATMIFALAAAAFFGLAPYFMWKNIILSLVIFLLSCIIFYLIAKSDRTR